MAAIVHERWRAGYHLAMFSLQAWLILIPFSWVMQYFTFVWIAFRVGLFLLVLGLVGFKCPRWVDNFHQLLMAYGFAVMFMITFQMQIKCVYYDFLHRPGELLLPVVAMGLM